jgi:hypothetical protein
MVGRSQHFLVAQVAISTGGPVRLSLSTTAVSSALAIDHPLGAVGTPSITFTGDLNTGIYSPAADTLAFVEGGVEAMRIDSSGRVGIGSTAPNRRLEVADASVDNFIRVTTTGSNKSGIELASGTSVYGNIHWDNSSNNLVLNHQWSSGALTFGTNSTERGRFDSSGRFLVGTSSQPNTGGTLCVNNGIAIVNNTTARFATVEHGSGANGTYATITISATVQSSTTTVIFEALMTGFSGVYLDNVIGRYSGLPAVTMRNNASAGTSAALTVNGANTTYTLTITTSVTHPVVKVKITAGGLSSDITLPTITFA